MGHSWALPQFPCRHCRTETHKWLGSRQLHAQLPECKCKMTHAWVNCGETADSKGAISAAPTLCRQSCTEVAGEPILAERRGSSSSSGCFLGRKGIRDRYREEPFPRTPFLASVREAHFPPSGWEPVNTTPSGRIYPAVCPASVGNGVLRPSVTGGAKAREMLQ